MTDQERVDALAKIHPDFAEWVKTRVKDGWNAAQLIGRLRVLMMVGGKPD
jgi:hypothetical protein